MNVSKSSGGNRKEVYDWDWRNIWQKLILNTLAVIAAQCTNQIILEMVVAFSRDVVSSQLFKIFQDYGYFGGVGHLSISCACLTLPEPRPARRKQQIHSIYIVTGLGTKQKADNRK